MLLNPVSTVVFTAAAVLFFRERVPDEEETLVDIFGTAYIEYAKRVPVRIPFVQGFI